MLMPPRRKRGRFSGRSASKRWKNSPNTNVARRIFRQLCRPGRVRSRLLLVLITITGLLLLHFGGYKANDLQRTALSFTTYVDTQFSSAFVHDQDVDATRWDDSQDPDIRNQSTNTFHLLIPVSKPSLNLCRTLLSASILKYPPPTLIGYGSEEDMDRPGIVAVRKALQFLDGDIVQDEDLVLVVDEDTVFQLPAEVLISRFFHTTHSSTLSLMDKFRRIPANFAEHASHPQPYHTNVLFAAQKNCTSSPFSPACYLAPHMPLPKTFQSPYSRFRSHYDIPLYMNSAMMMGTAGNLRSLYKHAFALMELGDRTGSQHMFSQVFGAQEYRRELYRQTTLSSFSKAYQWIASKLVPNHPYRHFQDQASHRNYSKSTGSNDFGIGLDYTSSTFQIIDDTSKTDIRPITFSNVSGSLQLPQRSVTRIHLPQDLNLTAAPFHVGSHILPQHLSWSDVPLITNMLNNISPTIPSALTLNSNLNASLPLWYEPHSRTLFRQSLRLSSNPIAVVTLPSIQAPKSAKFRAEFTGARVEVQYVDLRGGRGGVWTDKGEWLGWDEVCEAFDDELFGDGKGSFVLEEDVKGKGGEKKDGGGGG